MGTKLWAIPGLMLMAAGGLPTAHAATVDFEAFSAAPPPRTAARGFPSRDPDLDALPGFKDLPPGYGEVPFWWWTGDRLDEKRLIWELEQLHRKGISGVQVNYAHEDSPGWPTYAADPPIFSEEWWGIWGRIAEACRKRGMGIGLSTYTLDWTGAENLFRRLFYSKPELNPLKLKPLPARRLKNGESITLEAPADLVLARAYRLENGKLHAGSVNLLVQTSPPGPSRSSTGPCPSRFRAPRRISSYDRPSISFRMMAVLSLSESFPRLFWSVCLLCFDSTRRSGEGCPEGGSIMISSPSSDRLKSDSKKGFRL